jgi:hypothetical protein
LENSKDAGITNQVEPPWTHSKQDRHSSCQQGTRSLYPRDRWRRRSARTIPSSQQPHKDNQQLKAKCQTVDRNTAAFVPRCLDDVRLKIVIEARANYRQSKTFVQKANISRLIDSGFRGTSASIFFNSSLHFTSLHSMTGSDNTFKVAISRTNTVGIAFVEGEIS